MEPFEEYEKFCDCFIVCPLSKNEYPMIKQMLLIKSGYFKALLSPGWNQSDELNKPNAKFSSPISLSDKTGWNFVRRYLLGCFHTDGIKLSQIISILSLCAAFSIHYLFENVQKRLMDNVLGVINVSSVEDLSILRNENLLVFDDMVKFYQLSYYNDEFADDVLLKIHYRLLLRKFVGEGSKMDDLKLKKMWPILSASITTSSNFQISFFSSQNQDNSLPLNFTKSEKSFTLSLIPTIELKMTSIVFSAGSLSIFYPTVVESSEEVMLSIDGIDKQGNKLNLYSGDLTSGDPILLNVTEEQYFVKFKICSSLQRTLYISSLESTWRRYLFES